MKFKKLRLPTLLLIGLLSSCALPYRDVSPLTSANAYYNFADNRDYRQIKASTIVIDRNVYSLSNYNPAYARRGYLEVLDSTTGLRGILSLLTDHLIVPATYSKFSYYSSASNGTYIRAYSSETSYDLYDYRGFLLKKNLDPNKKLTIKATTETLRYERKHLIEVITYDGASESNEVFKDGSRKSFVAPCDLLWVDDTGFIPGTSELSDLAMEGCIGTIEHDRTFTVKKEDATLCSFKIPDSNVSLFMWKCFFYQYGEEVGEDDYDFVYQNKYIKMHTCRIELATGKVQEIQTNLLINKISPIYSSSGQVRYAVAQGIHYANHEFDNKTGLYVIDNNAHEYWNATEDPCYDPEGYLVDWNTAYSPYFGTFINQSLEPYFPLHAWELGKINYTTRSIITIKDSGYGISSFAGKVLINPEYSQISFAKDGSSLALGKKDGVYYTLDYKNNVQTPHSFEANEWGSDLGNGFLRCHSLTTIDDHSFQSTYYRDYSWNKIDYFSWAVYVQTYNLSTFFDSVQIDVFSPEHEYDYYTYKVFSLAEVSA